MITRQLKHKFLLLTFSSLLLLIFFASCGRNTVFSEYKKIPEAGWKASDKLTYEVNVENNKIYHNVFLTVRHAEQYPFNNIFLFLTTTYPDGKQSVDTLEIMLANPQGEWLGKGSGDIWDNKTPIKKNVMFPQNGKYTFTFEQGMRTDPLPLIMDFGMVVEKVE